MLSSIQTNFIEPFLVLRQTVAPLKLSRWQFTKLVANTVLDRLPDGSLLFVLAAVGTISIVYYYYHHLWYNSQPVQVIPGLAVVKRKHVHYIDIIKEGRELVCTTNLLSC